MKWLLALSLSLFVFASCSEERDCPDDTLVNSLPCPTEGRPVCGCNGVTYDNECLAERTGIWVDYEGECVD